MIMAPYRIVTLICLYFCLASYGIGQSYEIYNSDTINVKDINNRKQGKWIYFFKSQASKIQKTGAYLNNRKTGLWKTYYINGNLKSEITYKNNRPDGYAKIYYENGKLSEEGLWKGTKWVGKSCSS